jgi:hypothetical protein
MAGSNVYGIDGKAEKKKLLKIPVCRWMDNIRIGLTAKLWGGMYWINMAQNGDQ